MCGVVEAVIAIGAITAATQGGIAGAQAEAQASQAKDQQKAIRAGELIQQQQPVERQGQEASAADARVDQINLETERATALAATMAGESGVSGNSPRAQLRAIRSQGLRGVTAVERNQAWAARNLGYEAQGVRARATRQELALNYGPGVGAAVTQGLLGGVATGLQLGATGAELWPEDWSLFSGAPDSGAPNSGAPDVKA